MFEWAGEPFWPRVGRFYRDQGRFFRLHLKTPFAWAVGIFLVFALAGYLYYAPDPSRASQAMKRLAESLIGDWPRDAAPAWNFLFILWNNIRVTAVACALGVVPVLFLPVLAAAGNGLALGLVVAFAGDLAWGAGKMAAGILPHGILELPAVWLAYALGLFLSAEMGRRIRRSFRRPSAGGGSGDERDEIFLGDLVVTFGAVVLPLLVVAAAVEAFLTPLLFARFH